MILNLVLSLLYFFKQWTAKLPPPASVPCFCCCKCGLNFIPQEVLLMKLTLLTPFEFWTLMPYIYLFLQFNCLCFGPYSTYISICFLVLLEIMFAFMFLFFLLVWDNFWKKGDSYFTLSSKTKVLKMFFGYFFAPPRPPVFKPLFLSLVV